MNVYTYYNQDPNLPSYEGLLQMWKRSWKKHGWTPVILNSKHARKHPLYLQMLDHVMTLPTVNSRQYTVNDFIRWLALDMVNGAVHTDSDVMNYGFTPNMVKPGFVFYNYDCPSVVSLNESSRLEVVNAMMSYKIPCIEIVGGVEKPHCSDQQMFRHLKDKLGIQFLRDCSTYGEDGWESASMVHYGTRAVRLKCPGLPKDRFPAFIHSQRTTV